MRVWPCRQCGRGRAMHIGPMAGGRCTLPPQGGERGWRRLSCSRGGPAPSIPSLLGWRWMGGSATDVFIVGGKKTGRWCDRSAPPRRWLAIAPLKVLRGCSRSSWPRFYRAGCWSAILTFIVLWRASACYRTSRLWYAVPRDSSSGTHLLFWWGFVNILGTCALS